MAKLKIKLEIQGLKQAVAHIKAAGLNVPKVLAGPFYMFAEEKIAGPARDTYVPVVTGALRSSIITQPPEVTQRKVTVQVGAGGPAAPYALCVTGRMKVPVLGAGLKEISVVKPGDKVLTQAGVWKPVKQVFRYSLDDGTILLRIRVPWRADKEHVLEVTENHHLMVERDGKNQWIRAGDV